MPLSPKALAAIKKEIWFLFVAYVEGFRTADPDRICKFDGFAAMIQQYHPEKFDYLELEDFQRWMLNQSAEAVG